MALAEMTRPVTSTITATVTRPEACAFRAAMGYSGTGRFNARPLSTPPDTGLTGALGALLGGGGASSTLTTAAAFGAAVLTALAGALSVTFALALGTALGNGCAGAFIFLAAPGAGDGVAAAVFTTESDCAGALLLAATCVGAFGCGAPGWSFLATVSSR